MDFESITSNKNGEKKGAAFLHSFNQRFLLSRWVCSSVYTSRVILVSNVWIL